MTTVFKESPINSLEYPSQEDPVKELLYSLGHSPGLCLSMLLGKWVFSWGREVPVWSFLHSLHSPTHPGPGGKKPLAVPSSYSFSALGGPWAVRAKNQGTWGCDGNGTKWEPRAWLLTVLPLEPPWSAFPHLWNQIVYYLISETLFQLCDSKSNKDKDTHCWMFLCCANVWKAKSLTYIFLFNPHGNSL